MGACVLILGDSGSGKSTSLRNFEPDEVGILNVLGKPLPFRKQLGKIDHAGYGAIHQALQRNTMRAYVIDDAGYLMSLENFRRSKESGYQKFTEMAYNFEQLIDTAMHTDNDTVVYILMHYDRDGEGRGKPKTIGKMIDEKFNIEGACPIVIQSTIIDGKHVFVTRGDGFNAAKAPMDMLPDVMDNDLKEVDSLIRDYWGLAPLKDKAPAKKGEKDAED
ncbi:MAG: hypothetical protein IKF56_02405 [Eggerthellaceae bacterium]|nr:hypothetical protein [Eggerthellaceae bacterium]